jgi:hypothetical protein
MALRRSHRFIAGLAIIGLSVLGTTACGTTVPGASLGSGLGAAAGTGSSPASSSGPGGAAPGIAGSSQSPGAAPGSNGVAGTGPASVAGPSQGAVMGSSQAPGVGANRASATGSASTSGNRSAADAPVPIGIGYSSDGAEFGSALGGSLDTGDEKLEAQTVVDWINRHGFELTNPAPWDQTEQAMCAAWTQDSHVLAAVWPGINAPTLIAQCLNAHQVPFFENGYVIHDDQDFRTWPNMIDAAELGGDAGARSYVETLWNQGFFGPQDKIGVLGEDYPAAASVYSDALLPQLAKHHLSVSVYYQVHTPQSTPDIGNSVSDIQSAVLKMRSQGVSKILFLCYGCAGFFMQDAQTQHWNPTYGLTTWDSLWYLSTSAPAAQLANSEAVGWMPLGDVPEQYAPPANATAQLCGQILQGQIGTQMPKSFAFNYCDALLTLRAAAQGLAQLSGASLEQGTGTLGQSYQSALSLHTAFGPQKHWGDDQVRLLKFDGTCPCFRYSGPDLPIVGS